MSTDLVPISNVMTLAEMSQLAKAVATSKLFGMQTPEQALVLMALCRSEGKDPIQAVRQYHIINGKPSMRADAMLAEFQARGGKVQWGERTNTVVSGTFSHPSGGELTVTWTLKDAQDAQITGNPTWKKFPRQMLTARVISEAIRTMLPGVVAGIYAPEEVEGFESPTASEGSIIRIDEPSAQLRHPSPKAIEPPKKGQTTNPTHAARVAFFTACDRLEVPIRGEDGKVIPAKVMETLEFLGWSGKDAPETPDAWAQSEELLNTSDIDALRAHLTLNTDDLSDPFTEEETLNA